MGQELQPETRDRPSGWDFMSALHGIGQYFLETKYSTGILLGPSWDPPGARLGHSWHISWDYPLGGLEIDHAN